METSLVPDQEKPLAVASYVRSCLLSLELCLEKAAKIHPRELSMVEDQFARFCVWKDSMGVFSSGRGSLDHRLREAPEVREIIITISETFNYRLQDCARVLDSLQSPDLVDSSLLSIHEELRTSLQEIKDEISLFHKFSNSIRRATKKAQNQKAEKLFIMKNDDGDDVEPFLADQFEHYIRGRFPDIGENIRKRLARTMVLRRKRILYRRSRYGKKAPRFPSLPSEPVVQRPEPKLEIQPPTKHLEAETSQEPIENPKIQPRKDITAPSNVQSAVQTATTLKPAAFQKASSPSVVSKSRSSALGGTQELQFPPSPCEGLIRSYEKLDKHEKRLIIAHLESNQPSDSHSRDKITPGMRHSSHIRGSNRRERIRGLHNFLEAYGEICCPFCFHFLPSLEAADEKKWQQHVKGDLDSYVCLFEECDTAEKLYSHSHEWFQHMRGHAKRWKCAAKSHEHFVANTRNEFLDHMKVSHAGKFSDFQLEIMADRNSLVKDLVFESCPLCGVEDIGTNMEGHIVGHMRHLALKSLPAYEQDAQEIIEPEKGEKESLALSGQQSRSTVKEELAGDTISPLFDSDISEASSDRWDIDEWFYPYDRSRVPIMGKISTTRWPYPPPPNFAVSENQEAVGSSVDTIIKRPNDHSCAYLEESLFDNIPFNERRAYEWGFALQSERASKDLEDDPVLQDFRSCFVPDLEPPANWNSIMPPLADYNFDDDILIRSFAAFAPGDVPPATPPNVKRVDTPHTLLSASLSCLAEFEASMSASSAEDNSPWTNTESSDTDEPRFAPLPREEDTWVRNQFEAVHEMLKRMDKPDPVRIAVLDTGCDLSAPHFLRFPKDRHRITWHDFVGESQGSVDEDGGDGEVGHGTLVVSLLLNLLPLAQVVVCRVARWRTKERAKHVTEAVCSAMKQVRANIFILASGLSLWTKGDILNLQISSIRKGILGKADILFAVAPNAWNNTFGRKMICVWGTDTNGNLIPESSSQRLNGSLPTFCTLAGTVTCDWEGNTLSGHSVATTVLAATAALFLQYISSFAKWKRRIDGEEYNEMANIERRGGMERLFRAIGTATDRENVWLIEPRALFFDVARWPQSYSHIFIEVAKKYHGLDIFE